MSKIIIYDNENILIANLEGKIKRKLVGEEFTIKDYVRVREYEHIARFSNFEVIHSISLKKQLKKIEKIFKYHKENKDE